MPDTNGPDTNGPATGGPDLATMQGGFAKAIRNGPDHVAFDEFDGDEHRVMMGFAVYANTISHGRLVALEDTFPYTLAHLGEEAFNQVSRDFVEAGGGSDAPLAELGAQFPQWLAQQGQIEAALFAQFEWSWLESYRAGEAEPFKRESLAGLDEAGLLGMSLARHPAARVVIATPAVIAAIGLTEASEQILITRPEADVLIHPAPVEVAGAFELLKSPQTVEQLLQTLSVQFDADDILPAILHLMDAGALVRA